MRNCFNCKHARDKYISSDEMEMIFYCEKKKRIDWTLNFAIYECEYYESNLHDHNAARSSPQTRDNGIHKEE